jgi:hypothetical protein
MRNKVQMQLVRKFSFWNFWLTHITFWLTYTHFAYPYNMGKLLEMLLC